MATNRQNDASCCGCIPIRPGVWVLAILGMIGSLWYMYEGGAFLAAGVTVDDLHPPPATKEARDAAAAILAVARVLAWNELVSGILNLGLSLLLIHGLIERKAGEMRMWVTCNLIFLTLGGIAALVIVIVTMVFAGAGPGILTLFFMALLFAWEGYYIWVVSKYSDIMEEEEEGCVGPVPYATA